MSMLDLGALRRRPLPPAATAVTALVVLGALLAGPAYQWLALQVGVGRAGLLEPWRPVTFGVVSGSLFSGLISAVFCYWILSGAERLWGSARTALVVLASVLAVAAVAVWFIPFRGLLPGAGLVAWGVICAQTYHVWRRGANVRDQLVILALCALLNLSGGALAIMMSLAAAAGGVAAAHAMWELRIKPRAAEDPYEAFVRARQGRAPRRQPDGTTLGIALCVALYLLWALRLLLG